MFPLCRFTKIFAASRAISIAPVTFVANTASKFLAVEIHEIFEDSGAGVVHENVEIAEFFHEFAIGPLDIRLDRHVGVNRMHTQFSRRLIELALVAPRDGDVRPACGE